MNIANKLTLSRILLIPIYIALFLADFNGHYFYAVAVYALASFTDFGRVSCKKQKLDFLFRQICRSVSR